MLSIKWAIGKFSKPTHPWNRDGRPEPSWERLERDDFDLDQIFERFATSPDVPARMLKMAGLFGLSRQQIAHPNKDAALIVKRCNSCPVARICFKTRDGKDRDNPGFKHERCPNLEAYRAKAARSDHRTPIRHQLH